MSCPCVGVFLSVFLKRMLSHHEEAVQDLIHHLVVMKELYLNSEQWKTWSFINT